MQNKIFNLNKKGITITSLTIYVIVATVIVGILVFLNANFFSNINELTDKASIVGESLDFKSAFIRDLKSENEMKVTDYSDNMIRLSNNVKYEIRVLDKDAEQKKYAIYRNDVQIAKNIVNHSVVEGQKVKEGPFFEYDSIRNTVKVGLKFYDGKNSYIEDGTYVVGKEVKISWENSMENNYSPFISGDKVTEEEIDVPENERIYASLYSDGTLLVGNTTVEDTTKSLITNFGEISTSIAKGEAMWLQNKNNIKVVDFRQPVIIPSLENIFSGCANLTEIVNITNMNIINVESAKNAFRNCISLNNIDISSWNTSNITDMSNMFAGCSSLETLNLDTLITNKVTNMSGMFKDCSKINDLRLNTISTQNVTNMSEMFSGCTSLVNLDLNRLETSNVTDMSSMFSNCTSLVNLNISHLDTSGVTSVNKLFYNCQSLSSVSIGNFNCSDVTDLSYMFYNCMNLVTVTLGNMQTSNVIDMSYLFSNCTKLMNINLENLDTSKVETMEGMFFNCQNLVEIDLAKYITENVTNMSNMFAGCSKLNNLENITLLDTSKVINMSGMFSDCKSLDMLNLNTGKFITSNVNDMSNMFKGCSNLKQLIITSFDTSSVTTFSSMFEGCSNLQELDLTSFDTNNALDLSRMFKDDVVLVNILIGNMWKEDYTDIDITDMLTNCGTSALEKA